MTQRFVQEKAMARAMFPRMPTTVFNLFLSPLIDDFGWPFSTIDDSLHGTRWEFILHRAPLRYIVECNWSLISFQPSLELFSEDSIQDLHYVLKNYKGTLLKSVDYDYEKCRASTYSKIRELGISKRFSEPVVLLQRGSLCQILDGNHRILAALTYVAKGADWVQLEAWVGRNQSEISTSQM